MRRERHPVRPRIQQHHQFPCPNLRHIAVPRKEVTGLADRPHHVYDLSPSITPYYGQNLVMSLVERRPNEIIHPGIGNDKRLCAVLFNVKHPRQKRSSLRHKKAPGLQQQVGTEPVCGSDHSHRIGSRAGRRVEICIPVLDPKPSPCIDIANIHAIRAQLSHQFSNTFNRSCKRLHATNL